MLGAFCNLCLSYPFPLWNMLSQGKPYTVPAALKEMGQD